MRPLNIFVAFFAVSVLLVGFLVGVGNYYQAVPTVSKPKLEQVALVEDKSVYKAESGKIGDGENITKDLANEISKDILVRNPNGPSKIGDEQWIDVVDPEKITDLVIGDGLKNFDAKDFESEISINQFKITSDNSVSAQTVYFKTFIDILTHNFQNIHADFTDPKLAGSSELFKSYDQAIGAFYNLEVPSQLVSYHQQELNLLTSQKKIFEALANYEKDPVRAILVNQLLSGVDAKLLDLGQTVMNYIQKNNLNI